MRALAFAVLHLLALCGAQLSTARFDAVPGKVLSAAVQDASGRGRSKADCVRALCQPALSCAVSFHAASGTCTAASINTRLFGWTIGASLTSDPSWTTLLPRSSAVTLELPAGLWSLNPVNRGRQLGTSGSSLNIVETGLANWNCAGPTGSPVLSLTTSNQAVINNANLLNFNSHFTIAAWVSTNGPKAVAIVEGTPFGSISFMLLKSGTSDELHLRLQYPKHYYRAKMDAAANRYWRHVAVVYRGVDNVQYFLNATSLTLTEKDYRDTSVIKPSRFLFGRTSLASNNFCMACLAVFERALSGAQLQDLMHTCP